MALFLIFSGAISGFPQYLFYKFGVNKTQIKKKDTCSNPG